MIIIQARQFSYYKLIVLISSEAKTKGWRVNLMRSLCWVTSDLVELHLWIFQSYKNFYSHLEGEDIRTEQVYLDAEDVQYRVPVIMC